MSDLTQRFEAAVANSKNLSERPDNPTLLKIYALYKQATAGDVSTEARPGFSDFVARHARVAVLHQRHVAVQLRARLCQRKSLCRQQRIQPLEPTRICCCVIHISTILISRAVTNR